MKTIAERATEYARITLYDDIEGYPADVASTNAFNSYFAGATEQKAIDIEKACKWLKENARDYACATIRCPYGEEEEIICDVHQEIVEDFRKAMEKQL